MIKEQIQQQSQRLIFSRCTCYGSCKGQLTSFSGKETMKLAFGIVRVATYKLNPFPIYILMRNLEYILIKIITFFPNFRCGLRNKLLSELSFLTKK